MNPVASTYEDIGAPTYTKTEGASSSGVTWAAVIAGAFVTAALSLILMALGAGMGLSSISPWPNAGLWISRAAPATILWIIFVQIVACAIGGYMAGRLRTRWVSLHTHEVYFRDTAHGFLVWAVALVISVILLTSFAGSIARDSASLSNGGVTSASDYFVDSLFRSDHPAVDRNDTAVRSEAHIILGHALAQPDVSQQDKAYLDSLVVASTGLDPASADARVTETITADREAVDAARKAVAHSLYWLFLALLVGAFCASFAATIGGRRRDRVPV